MNDSLRERALRLLARREHARAELVRKLAPHAESAEVLDALLDELTASHLLSDERYAEMRVSARGPRFGNARLVQELRSQGVPGELVDAALIAGEDELERARRVWQKKFGSAPESREAENRARQMRFMMSRGFSTEIIRRIMRGDSEND